MALRKSWQALQLAREEVDRKTIEVEGLTKLLHGARSQTSKASAAAAAAVSQLQVVEAELGLRTQQLEEMQSQLGESDSSGAAGIEAAEVAEARCARLRVELQAATDAGERLKEELGATEARQRRSARALEERESRLVDKELEADVQMQKAGELQQLSADRERHAADDARRAEDMWQQARDREQHAQKSQATAKAAARQMEEREARAEQMANKAAESELLAELAQRQAAQLAQDSDAKESQWAHKVAELEAEIAAMAKAAEAEADRVSAQLRDAEARARAAECGESSVAALGADLQALEHELERKEGDAGEMREQMEQALLGTEAAQQARCAAQARAEAAELETAETSAKLTEAVERAGRLQAELLSKHGIEEISGFNQGTVDDEHGKPLVASAVMGYQGLRPEQPPAGAVSGADLDDSPSSPVASGETARMPLTTHESDMRASAELKHTGKRLSRPNNGSRSPKKLYTELSAAGVDTIWMYADRRSPLAERGAVIKLSEHPGLAWRVLDPVLGLLQTARGEPVSSEVTESHAGDDA